MAKLDRERIVREAIALMAAEGLHQVSLRKVAARLDARAPSLYWHVADKGALHQLMAETIYRDCLAAMAPATTWQDWLRGFAESLWRAQRRWRDAHQLILTVRMADPGERRSPPAEAVAPLVGLGLDADVAEVASASVQALVTGWTTLDRTGSDAPDARFGTSLDALILGWEEQARKGAERS